MIQARAEKLGMHFANLWDAVNADQFTDNEVHYTPAAAKQVAHLIGKEILKMAGAASAKDDHVTRQQPQ